MKSSLSLLTALSFTLCLTAHAADATDSPESVTTRASKWTLELEAGPAWFGRNNVRIPNDTGTRFDMLKLTGDGPVPYARLYATYDFNERHALRLNLAPLSVTGNGSLDKAVRFQDGDFAVDTPTRGRYKFNTYRMTYRWMFHSSAKGDLGLGAALLVRDAERALRHLRAELLICRSNCSTSCRRVGMYSVAIALWKAGPTITVCVPSLGCTSQLSGRAIVSDEWTTAEKAHL